MLKVLFFARVKEELDCAELEFDWAENIADLDSLQAKLIHDGGECWRETLQRSNMIRAVNHSVIAGNTKLADGDEVAFFPPVTGG